MTCKGLLTYLGVEVIVLHTSFRAQMGTFYLSLLGLYFRNVDLHLPKILPLFWTPVLSRYDVTKESSCASVTNKFHSGKLCSALPTECFPYADGCAIAVTYLVLLPVSWKSDVILVRIRRTVSSQDSSSCLPMSTFTSGASNATYNTLSWHPRKVWDVPTQSRVLIL